MADKYQAKIEKQKLKYEAKLRKKQLKYEAEKAESEKDKDGANESSQIETISPSAKSGSDKPIIKVVLPQEEEKPWYKNPSWIRAISGVIIMIIVLITFIMTYYR
jgi:hypothetical protein